MTDQDPPAVDQDEPITKRSGAAEAGALSPFSILPGDPAGGSKGCKASETIGGGQARLGRRPGVAGNRRRSEGDYG